MAKEAKTRINYLLASVFALILYFVVNRMVTPRFMPVTYVDELVPFTPIFGVIYSSYLVFLPLWIGYAFLNYSLKRYQQLTWTLVAVQVVAYAAYVVFPSKILRPVLSKGAFEYVVSWIYYIDNPTNLTPSLHVANSILMALFMHRVRRLKVIVWTWAILIVFSTMAVKQHYFVDVVSGVALSVAVYLASERYTRNERIRHENENVHLP